MRTEGLKGALLSILVISSLIASTMSLLSLSLAFAEPGQSPPLGGGNLVIVQSVDANSLDVHRTRFDLAYQAIALVHDTLMTFDYEMKYIPLLAESWEVDPNGLYIDYHLRKDVKFHCGEPFNADAVVYTIRRVKEPWSAHADSVKNILDVEKLDEYTVRIHLKQWDRWLYDWFATTSSSIVCPRCAEEHGLDYGEKYFCGTGPFKVKEWIREDRLILERNEDYRWGPEIYQNTGPAHIAGVTFEVIPTDISREDKFKKGEADMMVGFSPRPALVDWLNTTENVIFIINASSSMSYVGFHVGTLSPEILQGIVSGRPYPPGAKDSPVSDDPEGKGLLVRKALLYATHRENLILYAWDGMGKVAYGPLTSVIWGYNPAMEDMYPYDPEMARSLLAQAGYAGGLELTVITTNYEPYTKTAQVLKDQWAKVGVTLNIEVRVFDDIETIIANAQHDLWIGGWTWHNADMIWWYWHTSRVPPASNRFWWGSAYTDALIENTFDIDDDVAYYAIQESQRLIMEDAAYLPVVERPFLLTHWDRVKGFRIHPLSNLVWKHLDTYLVDEGLVGWDASITATFSDGSDNAIFSVRPDGTSGFDYAYDIPEPPVLPEPPHVRVYFYYPEQTPDKLHRSCLAPENLMEWPLRIEYAEGLDDITLTWNVEDVPADYSIFLYRGGDLVADMRAGENYTFEASTGSYDFRIVVGKLLPFTLELAQGWNMISFPVLPENSSPDSIFDGYYVLYRWDAEDKRYMPHADSGSFIEPDPDVEPGVGYWAYVLEDENVDLLGVPVYQLNLSLSQGWNLIGPPYGGSSIADLADDPDISVLPHAFTWNAREKSYSMTQLLEAGKGYWVYALQPPQPPYPAISATSAKVDNEIRINVMTGSIPWGEWAYSISPTEGSYSWTTGTEELDPPYVSLGTYALGTYYVTLKHIDSGHLYFHDQMITIS